MSIPQMFQEIADQQKFILGIEDACTIFQNQLTF